MRSRPGFTLFELMLVMAVILVAAAIGIPAIDAMMGDSRLKAARDIVRARWADVRGRAMKEGQPYKFSVMYGTSKYKIEPEDPNAPSDPDNPPLIQEGELPKNILFAQDQGGAASSGSSGSSDYQVVAIYLADGRARDDVKVMLGKEGGHSIGLKLRALTGAVSMIDTADQENGP